MESGRHEKMIREDVAEAENGGVQGTPVFVLAFTDPKRAKSLRRARHRRLAAVLGVQGGHRRDARAGRTAAR